MIKRLATVASVFVLVATCLWAGAASSQETTTTLPDEVTTTDVPATTEVPETTEAPPTTEVDPSATTTTPDTTTTTVVPPQLTELPGQLVTSGSLSFDIRFAGSPESNCNKSVDLAGGQVNIGFDEAGKIGGVYGLAPSGSGSVGVYMVGLGAVPAGVGIVSVSDGECEFDAVGIGSFASSSGVARLAGVGAGVHPGSYDTGEYVSTFLVEASVGSSAAPAVLDADYVRSFLLRDRPGLVLPQG